MVKQFLLSSALLFIDILGLQAHAGEADAFLFAGLFFLAAPLFVEGVISLAPKQD
jgi:hypothetical protein